jgi:hypothetical protein
MGRPKGSKNKKTLLKEQEEATAKLHGATQEPTDSPEEDGDLCDRIAGMPQMVEKSE